MTQPRRPPAPLPEHRVEFDRLSDWYAAHGRAPTPEAAPELFADDLAAEGADLFRVEPYIPAADLFADALDARHAVGRALERVRVRAARQWLWTNRERVRLKGRVLCLPADLTDDEKVLMGWVKGEVVKLLRDGECDGWFAVESGTVATTT